ncbi:unnamed protein product, partial [Rotaria sp. Silwood2]
IPGNIDLNLPFIPAISLDRIEHKRTHRRVKLFKS